MVSGAGGPNQSPSTRPARPSLFTCPSVKMTAGKEITSKSIRHGPRELVSPVWVPHPGPVVRLSDPGGDAPLAGDAAVPAATPGAHRHRLRRRGALDPVGPRGQLARPAHPRGHLGLVVPGIDGPGFLGQPAAEAD